MGYIKVNDIQMYYEIHGEGTPLVIVPGLNTPTSDYRTIIPLFSNKYKVIIFDNRGAGKTDKPKTPYSIPMMANDMYELLTTLQIGPSNILGISMGGKIAMEFTLQHPECVTSLILVSTSAITIPNRGRYIASLSIRIPFIRGREQPYYASRFQFQASQEYNCAEQLSNIHTPTLIMYGKGDKLVPNILREELHSNIQNAQMILFNGGHTFLFFHPKTFTDSVVDFLSRSA